MQIGIMIGPERGQYRAKVGRLIADAQDAERDGFVSIWVPQVPDDFDALTACALMGHATQTVEIGTAVMPIQTRHPVAMAQQTLANQAICEGRFTLGLGPSHHWIVEIMLGLSYDKPARQMRHYLEAMNIGLAGPGPFDIENDSFRIHSPIDVTDLVPTPILLSALAPVMLQLAGEHASGTILWMADERAIGEHIAPRIVSAAAGAGRPAPRVVAGVPVTLCNNDQVDDVRMWTNVALGHAEFSPNYQRLLEEGNAADVGDLLAAGDEASVIKRLESFRDAGATDLAVRVVPFGKTRPDRIASRARTIEFLSSICPTL